MKLRLLLLSSLLVVVAAVVIPPAGVIVTVLAFTALGLTAIFAADYRRALEPLRAPAPLIAFAAGEPAPAVWRTAA